MLTDTHLIMEAPHQLLGPPDEYTNSQTAHHYQDLHADANNSPSVDEVAVLLGGCDDANQKSARALVDMLSKLSSRHARSLHSGVRGRGRPSPHLGRRTHSCHSRACAQRRAAAHA